MKTYGNREEVYTGLAKKTRGGLTKNDIILKGGKYISRRISEIMRNVRSNPLGVIGMMNRKRVQPHRSCKNNYNNYGGSNSSVMRRNKKSKKRVRFVLSNNKVNQYYCPEMNGGDFHSKNTSNKFQITNVPDIDVESLFLD